MEFINLKDVSRIVGLMTETILANEQAFCELDSAAGDGDFGMSLSKGFRKLEEERPDDSGSDIGAFLIGCSRIITEHCGGASGPIWGTAFRSAGKYAQSREKLSVHEAGVMVNEAVAGIMKRGGAKAGDKTLLDALIPLGEALVKSGQDGLSFSEAMGAAAKAARLGADSSKDMIASRGRASYVGERSLSHPDAGAEAIAIIMQDISDRF